jgi:hypothetical protein
MTKQKIIVSVIVATAIVACVVGLAMYYQRRAEIDFAQDPVSGMKESCRLTLNSPFEDKSLQLRFRFSPDLLVCDLASHPGTWRLFLWKKEAFESSTTVTFFPGIVGEISVNLPSNAPNVPHIPDGASVREETSTVAGIVTTVRETWFPNCSGGSCPTQRMATVEHGGNTYVLAEFNSSAGLLESTEFIDDSVSSSKRSGPSH